MIGPIVLARRDPADSPLAPPAGRGGGAAACEFVALYVAGERESSARVSGAERPACITLLAPRRYLTALLPPGVQLGPLPRSASVRVLRRYLDSLLDLDAERLCERQKTLAASAVRSLLSAAVAPTRAAQGGLRARRRDALMDRLIAHVDANLGEELTVETLCAALGCSRTVLYRATTEAGGAAELIQRRRLLAIRAHLQSGDEHRSLAALADAYHFADVVHLNRRFKAMFGAPPGEVRRGRASTAGNVRPPTRRTPDGSHQPLAGLPCR